MIIVDEKNVVSFVFRSLHVQIRHVWVIFSEIFISFQNDEWLYCDFITYQIIDSLREEKIKKIVMEHHGLEQNAS